MQNLFIKDWQIREQQLSKLSFASYQEFLESDFWKDFKKDAARRKNFQVCFLCSSTDDVDLHHTSYRDLSPNSNKFRHIMAFCRHHHKEIHDFAKEHQISILNATKKIRKKWQKDGNIEHWLRKKIKKQPECKKWNHLLVGKSIEPIT